jgi:hypothetical protein
MLSNLLYLNWSFKPMRFESITRPTFKIVKKLRKDNDIRVKRIGLIYSHSIFLIFQIIGIRLRKQREIQSSRRYRKSKSFRPFSSKQKILGFNLQ